MAGQCGWVGCAGHGCLFCGTMHLVAAEPDWTDVGSYPPDGVEAELGRLRAEVERLTRERDEALAEAGNWRTLHAGTLKECDNRLAERTRERDEAVGHLREVLGGECEIAGRWCLTHHTNDCAVPAAREFLARVKP